MMLFFVILWSVVRHFPKNEICYFSNPVLLDIERNSSGEDTEIWQEDGRYAANVKVQISPTFWGWLFQFGGRMRLKAPAPLREEMERQLSLLADRTKG